MIRQLVIAATLAAATFALLPQPGSAQQMVSAERIYKKLKSTAPITKAMRRDIGRKPVTIARIKRERKIRRHLPAIDIQSINFAFGSAHIPRHESWKVGTIADALLRFRGRHERVLLEGHTDAVGSWGANLNLSEARARSLKRALVNWYGVPRRMLVTVGYGEEHLVVPTHAPEWRNRRVTLRRLTGILN